VKDCVKKYLLFSTIFDLAGNRKKLEELTAEMASEDIWNDREHAENISRTKKRIEEKVNTLDQMSRLEEDLGALFELAGEEDDPSLEEDARKMLDDLEVIVDDQEFKQMLSGASDRANAIVTINSGAGGTESQDWAAMLMRMYQRYTERNRYNWNLIDMQDGEEAGIKNMTAIVEGDFAYGYLKAEAGVHRLVRISPFDSNKRRHTSFASVFITPEIDDSIEIEIEEKDLRIDTYHSSGKGGQHVNTTDSAVRITHFPTGIVVTCQNERSQHKNKHTAMKILKSKLYEYELSKQREEHDKMSAPKMEISFGSQIRSYVLHPYRMVKDHRTDLENSNVIDVLDGNLNEFIRTFLLSR